MNRNPFLTAPFAECIFRREKTDEPLSAPEAGMVRLSVLAPEILPDEDLVITGSTPRLGNWNPANAPVLNAAEFPVWSIDLPRDSAGAEYKFVIRNRHTGAVIWEDGGNRVFNGVDEEDLTFRQTGHRWRGSGVAIPVFSLRSESDFGVGDFADLKLMADWAKATGQCFIQILPVNDTTMSRTNADSYPYNANSTFALHPMYLRLSELGEPKSDSDRKRFEKLRRELNSRPVVDYAAVNRAKEEYARLIFAEQGEDTLRSEEFADFVAKNARWLLPYAAYCTLRDLYETADFSQWGDDAVYSPGRVVQLLVIRTKDMEYFMYVQYHLDRQLRSAHKYARSLGVALKGDIPIGISSTSVDAWQNPELFNLGMQAGAPPDDFAVLGQNWGFPTYNWTRMATDDYAWWRARLGKMSEYFDAYRIDHVLGFFRIWQIPQGALHGLLGHFSPAMPLSPEEMRSAFGFEFSPTMIAPGTSTGSYPTQAEAVAAGDEMAADAFDDVLFVTDPESPGHYHPRIQGHKTTHYLSLTDEQRMAFNRLYEDFFYHRHTEFWRQKAMQKLPALISATSMLPCAEDLGMIPASVPQVLTDLHILSLEVQRMPKAFGREFGHPADYPYMSVCTTSTHDMAGIRGWLAADPERAGRFMVEEFADHTPYPAGDPSAEICERIVRFHLDSPSMLTIIPLQDYLATDAGVRRIDYKAEQINNPADPHHYWCYRLHIPIESLPIHDFSRE